MLLMVIVEFPVLLIVNVLCADEPTITLPKARLPLREIIRVGAAVPVPDAEMLLTPLVLSELTAPVPLYLVAKTGENATVPGCDPPATIVPDQLPLNPLG